MIKAIYDQPANTILSGEKPKAFPLKSENRQGCLLSPALFKTSQNISHSNQARERVSIQMGEEEVQAPLLETTQSSAYKTQKFIKRCLQLMTKFSHAVGHKISTQKPKYFPVRHT